jgi:mRNA-degrading endonuclease RelE of RelBE toxin-antitoxin system
MRIAWAASFRKDYLILSEIIRKKVIKQIKLLQIDHTHPSLHIEGISNRRGLFSARVNKRYRISFEFTGNDTILLRRVRDHDDLYLKP